jgi:hypothetical protein
MFSGCPLAKCEVPATKDSSHDTKLEAPLSFRVTSELEQKLNKLKLLANQPDRLPP